jgi:hypothetical protein
MDIALYVFYFVLILGALAAVFIAYTLQRRFPFQYLNLLFYYIITVFIYMVLVNIIPELFWIFHGKEILKLGIFVTLGDSFLCLHKMSA